MNLDVEKCRHLFEILDSRESRKSTVIVSQIEYIEGFYNTTRMHSHCGYESPQDFENNI